MSKSTNFQEVMSSQKSSFVSDPTEIKKKIPVTSILCPVLFDTTLFPKKATYMSFPHFRIRVFTPTAEEGIGSLLTNKGHESVLPLPSPPLFPPPSQIPGPLGDFPETVTNLLK